MLLADQLCSGRFGVRSTVGQPSGHRWRREKFCSSSFLVFLILGRRNSTLLDHAHLAIGLSLHNCGINISSSSHGTLTFDELEILGKPGSVQVILRVLPTSEHSIEYSNLRLVSTVLNTSMCVTLLPLVVMICVRTPVMHLSVFPGGRREDVMTFFSTPPLEFPLRRQQ